MLSGICLLFFILTWGKEVSTCPLPPPPFLLDPLVKDNFVKWAVGVFCEVGCLISSDGRNCCGYYTFFFFFVLDLLLSGIYLFIF